MLSGPALEVIDLDPELPRAFDVQGFMLLYISDSPCQHSFGLSPVDNPGIPCPSTGRRERADVRSREQASR